MASELRVNTLKDASGNNSIGMSYVAEGTGKSWYIFDGTAGTPAFADSFNCASLTDVGTGRQAPNWTNNMRAANEYAHNTNATNLSALYSPGTTTTSKSERFNTNDAGTYQDRTLSCGAIFGDLA